MFLHYRLSYLLISDIIATSTSIFVNGVLEHTIFLNTVFALSDNFGSASVCICLTAFNCCTVLTSVVEGFDIGLPPGLFSSTFSILPGEPGHQAVSSSCEVFSFPGGSDFIVNWVRMRLLFASWTALSLIAFIS